MSSVPSKTLTRESFDIDVEPAGASPFLFLVFEASQPLKLPMRCPLDGIDEVRIGRDRERRGVVVTAEGRQLLDIRIADPTVSTLHARIQREASGRWLLEDVGSKNGTQVNDTDISQSPRALEDGDIFEIGTCFFLFRSALRSRTSDQRVVEAVDLEEPAGLRSLAPALSHAFREVLRIARSTLPVLIVGETGTGKEVLARAIHAASGRPGRFMAPNCGELTATLLQDQLFGHTKGAFTGAAGDHLGIVRHAAGGTLFLDEVGELSTAGQVALLRVLQEHEVTPIGSSVPVPVDLRIIAATNRDPETMLARGQMRADFLARLSGSSVRLPPLRERREDIGLLVAALLKRLRPRPEQVSFTVEAARALLRHDWPLNIRELEKTLERGLALRSGSMLTPDHLFPDAASRPIAVGPATETPPEQDDLADRLRTLLARHDGNISAVAKALGKDPKQIRRWMERFGIRAEDYRS